MKYVELACEFCCHLLLDLMKKFAPSCIINVSSKLHELVRGPLDFTLHGEGSNVKQSKLEGYVVSKLANIYHSRFLSEELTGTKITINAMHPGLTGTNINNINVKNLVKRNVNIIIRRLSVWLGRSPEDAAKISIYIAVDPELTEVTGEHLGNVTKQTKSLSNLALDKEQAKKMREISFLASPSKSTKAEEEESLVEAAATTVAATASIASAETAAANVTSVEAAERIKAATVESTNVSASEIHTISESDLPTPPCSFTPSLDAINNKNLEEIEDLSSNVCSSTNESKETVQEAIYKPLILPEITESNEHYPTLDGDTNLNCDTTNACSDRTRL
uniref:Uncharacterized protein n=1 Tax=Octopus bimaculoides TaxID=37653 RepID=A0A0L8HJK3_OCTBM